MSDKQLTNTWEEIDATTSALKTDAAAGKVLSETDFTSIKDTKLSGIEDSADVTDDVNVGSALTGTTAKTTPVNGDTLPLSDSADSNLLKKVTWGNIKSTLKTYFDTLYSTVSDAFSKGSDTLDDIADGVTYVKSTNDFADADHDKLDGIEANADVTDTDNVTSAGALMDSEVTNLADVKSFDPSDYAPALGADDNYVTDAEKTVIGNTSGTNTGDQSAGDFSHNSLAGLNDGDNYEHITKTQKDKLDGIEDGADVTDATNVNAVESDPVVGAVSGIVKADGGGNISAAVAGTDYNAALSSDINAALTGASSPAAGNVFATVDDVPTDVNELADEDNSITYEVIGVACSDESTDLETGEAVAFDMPYGFTVTRVYCSVVTAPVGSAIQVDVEDEGTTILDSVVSIAASANNGETSTFTGSASSYAFSKGDLISFDIDQIGSSTAGAGLKVFLEGYRT